MHITKNDLSSTKVELVIAADETFLAAAKEHILGELARSMSVVGFRKGHAPRSLIEKHVDSAELQSRFLDYAINQAYTEAVVTEKLRPVAQPEVTLSKFVPFTTLEFVATIVVIGTVTLPDYKKIRLSKQIEPTTQKDVVAVLEDLRQRDSARQDVPRSAKDGDEVVIDFAGVDTESQAPISGGSGTDYALVLGGGAFIPGFEPQLLGLKAGDKKTFDVAFPDNYNATELRGKKATFTVTVKTVREITLPKLDDEFAAKVGPFKTIAELKADIKKQLQVEKDTQAQRNLENELLTMIAQQANVDIPAVLIDEEVDRMEEEERRNLTYRGQTWQEHLQGEGKTAEQHREGLREAAETRVKTGLALGELAEIEGIDATDADLSGRITQLKARYDDKQMRAELDKPENHRELRNRIITEKTIACLVGYATAS